MRQITPGIIIGFCIIIVSFIILTTSGGYGGTIVTNISLSAPKEISSPNFSVSTTVSSSMGTPFTGTTYVLNLNQIMNYGNIENTQQIQLKDPIFHFIAEKTQTIYAINIPFVSIQGLSTYTQPITWKISTDLNATNVILKGNIDPAYYSQMLNEGRLLLAFNTGQTESIGNSIQYLQMTINQNYYISFDTSSLIYTIAGSPSLSNLQLYNNTSLESITPNIILMSGSSYNQILSSNGVNTFNLTTNSTSTFILAYYFDLSNTFEASYAWQEVRMSTSTQLNITGENYTGSIGDTFSLYAGVTENSIPLINVPVTFSIYRDNVWLDLGTVLTTTSGVAKYNYTPNAFIGLIYYKTSTYYNGLTTYCISQITINKASAKFSNLLATGIYASLNNSMSLVNLSGNLLNQNNYPISGAEIVISSNITKNVVTDTNGYFSTTFNENLIPGVYYNYYTLQFQSPQYNTQISFLNLSVEKGYLQINTPSINETYINQPIKINGTVTDAYNNLVNAPLTLYWFDGSIWKNLCSLSTNNGYLNYTLPITNAGTQSYKIISSETQFFVQRVVIFNINILKSSSFITRGNLPNFVGIEYHTVGIFKVQVLDQNNNPIAGIPVNMSIPNDLLGSTYTYYKTNLTNSTGWAVFNWMPDDWYATYMNYYFPLLFTTSDINHLNSSFQYSFKINPTTPVVTLNIQSQPQIDSPSIITAVIKDKLGYNVQNGTHITFTIEDVPYDLIITNGKVSFSHTFTLISRNMFNYTFLQSYPYNSVSGTYYYTILKGQYHTNLKDLSATMGDYAVFNISIFNQINSTMNNLGFNLYINNNLIGNYWINNSYLVVKYLENLPIGTYNYRIEISSSVSYNSLSETHLMTISKIKSNLIITNYPSVYNYGDSATVSAKFYIDNLDIPITYTKLNVNFGGDISQITTNNLGTASFQLPPFKLPGTYNLTITFAGNNTVLPISKQVTIIINGSNTVINWIISPSDTYYGDQLIFCFKVTNTNNQGLSNLNVLITINSVKWIYTTNNTGYVNFDKIVKFNSSQLTIDVYVNATGGYNSSNDIKIINQPKRNLQGNLIVNNGINETSYDGFVNSTIYIYYQSNPIQNVQVLVYVYDEVNLKYILIQSYTTDVNGHVFLQFNSLDSLGRFGSTGSYEKVRFVTNNEYYNQKMYDYLILIKKAKLSVIVTHSDFYYNTDGTITFNVISFNNTVSGLSITITYEPNSQTLYTDTKQSNQYGTTTFTFAIQDSGQVNINYVIQGGSNYLDLQGIVTLQIKPVSLTHASYISDQNAQVNLKMSILDPFGIKPNITLIIDLNGYNYSISYFSYLNGFPLTIQDTNQVTIIFNGNSKYLPFSYSMSFSRTTVTLSNTNWKAYTNLYNNFTSNVLDNNANSYSFTGYTANIYLNNGSNYYLFSTKTDSQLAYFRSQYFVNLDPGTYTLLVIFPQQGIIKESRITVTLTVYLQDVTFKVNATQAIVGQLTSIPVNVICYSNLNGNSIELQIYDGTWQSISTSTIGITNDVNFQFTLNKSVGNYQFRIILAPTTTTNSSTYIFTLQVRQGIKMQYQVIQDIVHLGGGKIEVIVTDNNTNLPVQNIKIDLYGFILTQYEVIGTGVTNSSGIAIITIPNTIKRPNNGIMNFKIVSNTNNIYGQTEIDFQHEVQPNWIKLNYNIINNGITNNKTVALNFSDYLGADLLSGTIVYNIFTSSGQLVYSGSINYQNNNIIVISGFLIGSYYLTIDFNYNDVNYSFNQVIINDVGFHKIDPTQITLTTLNGTSDYLDNNPFFFQVSQNDYLLNNIDIQIQFNNHVYTSRIINGYFNFTANCLPGTYKLIVSINNQGLLSSSIPLSLTTYVVVNKSDKSFSYKIINGVYYPYNDLSISINDKFNANSTYIITINGSHYSYELTTSDINVVLKSNSLNIYPGTYSLNITRINSLLISKSILSNLKVDQIPVTIKAQYSQFITSGTPNIQIKYSISNLVGNYPLNFSIEIVYNSKSYTLYTQNLTITIERPINGQFNVIINTLGYYKGVVSIIIPNVDGGTNGNNFSLGPDVYFMAAIVIFAGSTKLMEKLKSKSKNKMLVI